MITLPWRTRPDEIVGGRARVRTRNRWLAVKIPHIRRSLDA